MKKLFTVLTVAFLFTSCATIFKGSTDTVNFTSEPSSADIYVNGVKMGKTPLQVELKSNKTYNIEYRLEGHETKNYILNNSVGAGYIVLDILFGLFPVIIDAATGNWYSLDQEHVNMILDKQK
ncbi:MAG: PEGA domain-containing protein [Melioribacteraceae bacterium]|nr:PEGA domain-containing protein [Melioribacteraceae bacterium]